GHFRIYPVHQPLNPLDVKKILLAGTLALFFANVGFAQNGNTYWERLNQSHPITTIDSLQQLSTSDATLGEFRLSMVYDGQFRNLSPETLALMETSGLKKKE